MRRRRSFNPKRRICVSGVAQERIKTLTESGRKPRYGGNPEHKKNPGDFGLEPPSAPRLGKTLCDSVNIFSRAKALELLLRGFSQGLFSEQLRGDWPQNIWAVSAEGHPLEAQLEGDGVYHGYPIPDDDPFRETVLANWVNE